MFSAILQALGLRENPAVVEAKKKTSLDHADPRKRFVFATIAMSYDADPAYLVEHAREAMLDWYGIRDRTALIDRLEYYMEGTESTRAYDLYRAMFLARAAVAVGFLSDAESWWWASAIASSVQRYYRDWASYGSDYVEGHVAYRQSQGDDPETLRDCRENARKNVASCATEWWAGTPFATPMR
jgi:hypothetical protein